MSLALAGGAEGLAGTTACPNKSVVRPPGKPEGVGPSADSGEEVGLRVSSDVIGLYLPYVPFIYVPRGDLPVGDELAEPRGGERIELVVIDRHSQHPAVPPAVRVQGSVQVADP